MKREDRHFALPRSITLRDGREFSIRLIEATDLPQMIVFYHDVPAIDGIYYRGTPEAMVARAEKWVSAAAEKATMVCLVLVDGAGGIHGEAWYSWTIEKPEVSLFGICLRLTVQGQGVGRLMMSRLLEIGDTYGPPRMCLTVQFENTRAWKLYTALGFIPLYEQMRGARIDAPPMPEFYMERVMGTAPRRERTALRVGWSSTDITPTQPAFLVGQFHGRLPEEPAEPLTITVLVLDNGEGCVAFVSCDLIAIFSELEQRVRSRLATDIPELNAGTIIINATHTHTGPGMADNRAFLTPELRERFAPHVPEIGPYREHVATRIVDAVADAWRKREPGKVAWGIDFAVIGRNRRWVDRDGKSTMYGNVAVPHFSHIEGYEDHSVNVLATYDPAGTLTGVVVNVPCPSQVSEQAYRFSADYWHETRQALRHQFGDALYVMPQCSAAGDQSPHPLYEKIALQRMQRLRDQTPRSAIAARLARAVTDIVATIGVEATADLPLRTETVVLNLPLNRITAEEAEEALREAEAFEVVRDAEIKKLSNNPELLKELRWYVPLTRTLRRAGWFRGVVTRYEQMKKTPEAATTVAIRGVRLGDIAFVGNPFEYYLDYGVMIKARSPFLQTFLIQLAGSGTYVPSLRSTLGGGYGSVPATNPVGPEGGMILAETTIALLDNLYADVE